MADVLPLSWGQPMPLIGREAERTAFELALDRAAPEGGAILLIVGDAGMGKTALLEHAVAGARDANVGVAWATVPDDDGAPPFWPWTALLRELAAAGGDATLAAAADALTTPEDPAGALEQRRFRIFEQVWQALRKVKPPALLVIDDLHRADGGTLRLLEFLAPHLRRSGLVLALGARPAAPGTDLAASFGVLVHAGATRIDLRPWSDSETAEVLTRLGVTVSQPALAAVQRATGGNPFFVLELARGTRPADGPIDLGRIPPTIIEVLGAEARRLDPARLEILRMAAAWGQGAPRELLAAATSQSIIEVMQRLPEHFLTADRAGSLWFRHDLVREAVYQGVPEHERGELHARLADAVERSPMAPDVRARYVAVHGCRAGPAWRPDVAFAASRAAANELAARYAVESAAAYLEFADGVRRWCTPDATRDLEFLVDYGSALTHAGDRARAQVVLTEALALARRADDIRACARISLLVGLGAETAGISDIEAWRLLDEVLAKLPHEEHYLRARLLARKAWQALSASDHEQLTAAAGEAVTEARASGAPDAMAQALAAYMIATAEQDAGLRQEVAREITASATLAQEIDLVFSGLLWEAQVAMERGDLPAARDAARRYRETAERWPLPYHAWYRWILDAAVAFLEDRLDDAEAAIAQVDPETTGQQPFAALLHVTQQMELAARRGDRAAFKAAGMAVLVSLHGAPVAAPVRAHVDACLGEHAAAARALDEFMGTLTQGPRDNDWLAALAEGALAAIHLDAREQGAILFDYLEPFRGSWVVVANATASRGPVSGILAGLARLMGDADAASALAAEARADAERAGAPGALFWSAGGPRWTESGSTPTPLAGLSAREREVLALLAAGCSNREIAAQLVLSVRTVQRHVENIYGKIGARGRAAASVFAATHGVATPDR